MSEDDSLETLRAEIEKALSAVQLHLGPNALSQANRSQPIRLSGNERSQIAFLVGEIVWRRYGKAPSGVSSEFLARLDTMTTEECVSALETL